jgi:hypothetical protein
VAALSSDRKDNGKCQAAEVVAQHSLAELAELVQVHISAVVLGPQIQTTGLPQRWAAVAPAE